MNKDNMVEILLVEDNDQDAELVTRSLNKNNITNSIVRVTNGELALDFLFGRNEFEHRSAKVQPKVVLLDLKMPKVDGLEVLKVMRAHEDTCNTPVVMMTSSKEERDMIESYKLGANSYVVKPLDFDVFMKAVRDIGFYWLLLNERPL
ncbi:MAG: response regulator [Bacteroidota bacterium]